MRNRGVAAPDRATLAYAFAAVEGAEVDIATHAGETNTEDLMTKAW